ncbi:MAG: hypothetical protein IH859_08135 [Chloroflexi bacterium]|nr:hypothetical protein [Chloroflexota bacterium]
MSKWVGWAAAFLLVWTFFAPALELLKVVQDCEQIIAEIERSWAVGSPY